MKISEMPIPFKVNSGMVTDASGYPITASCELAHELCSILNAHFAPKGEPKAITPQPNREETDAIAAKYYESGRKVEVQFWDSKQWDSGCWKDDGEFNPSFDYSLPWRIKPSKRRVVVEIYRISKDMLISLIKENEPIHVEKDWVLLGTAECEVEA